jgi:RND superfamily putative drug exporter
VSALAAVARFLTGRRSKWVVVLIGLLAAGIFGPLGGKQDLTTDPTAFLPGSAQSTQVVRLQSHFPSGQSNPAIVIYASDAPLDAAAKAAIDADRAQFATVATDGQVAPTQYSADGKAALVVVPLRSSLPQNLFKADVEHLRTVASSGLPPGVQAKVGGPAGYVVDLVDAFSGINTKLLLATILVVALVLIITYRSPFLWLVPLVVIGIADQTASAIVYLLASRAGLVVNGESAGILRVLVFGAGTDYALLLIARYREELRENEDRHVAMFKAVTGAGPAIVASAATVTISLLVLGLTSTLNNNRSLGFVGAIGIVVALIFGLLLLPAVLLLFGRRLFWPFVPQLGQADPTRTGFWARTGGRVSRRPLQVAAGCVVLLVVLASGLLTLHTGLTQSQQFRNQTPSSEAQALLAAHFPAGASAPVYVVADAGQADAVAAAVRADPGVLGVTETGRTDDLVQFTVTIAAAPDSAGAYDTIDRLRSEVATVPDAHALVGGSVATDLDTNDAARHDTLVVIPAVLAVIFLVLIVLLRALVAPVVLILTVVASYLASLGAATWAFTHLFGFAGVDPTVPLLGFLFLVAFGVDYNIFLISRARQEAMVVGARPGILDALAVTGGVITSAGVVLAATFLVLGVLPILTDVGLLVAFGVLLDTLVVRSVLVPALAFELDRRFWWPGTLYSRPVQPADPEPVGPGTRPG